MNEDGLKRKALMADVLDAVHRKTVHSDLARQADEDLEKLDGQIEAAGYSPVELVTEALDTLYPQRT